MHLRGKDQALDIWRFSETNLDLLKQEVIQDDKTIEFKHEGTFSIASTEQEFHELKEVHKLMISMGIQTEAVDTQGVQKRLGATGFVGGIKYLLDAEVNPIKLTEKIAKLCGAEIFGDSEVIAIETEGASRKVRTESGDFTCDMVVLATNGYSPLLSSYFKDKIYPTKGQILITEPVEPFMESPCYCNFVLDYFRQLPTGQLIIGGFRQVEKETEVGYSDHITDAIQNSLEEFFRRHLKKLSNAKITHRWSGVMGFSADGQPLVGSLPDDPQVFFLGGFTAHGLGLAFHSAKCMVDMMFEREIPSFISARRFQK